MSTLSLREYECAVSLCEYELCLLETCTSQVNIYESGLATSRLILPSLCLRDLAIFHL